LVTLSKELERYSSSKEKTDKSRIVTRAIGLLGKEYGSKLQPSEYVEALDILGEIKNAVIFLAIDNPERRDLWLEKQLGIHWSGGMY
jgi:hypothetical protein